MVDSTGSAGRRRTMVASLARLDVAGFRAARRGAAPTEPGPLAQRGQPSSPTSAPRLAFLRVLGRGIDNVLTRATTPHRPAAAPEDPVSAWFADDRTLAGVEARLATLADDGSTLTAALAQVVALSNRPPPDDVLEPDRRSARARGLHAILAAQREQEVVHAAVLHGLVQAADDLPAAERGSVLRGVMDFIEHVADRRLRHFAQVAEPQRMVDETAATMLWLLPALPTDIEAGRHLVHPLASLLALATRPMHGETLAAIQALRRLYGERRGTLLHSLGALLAGVSIMTPDQQLDCLAATHDAFASALATQGPNAAAAFTALQDLHEHMDDLLQDLAWSPDAEVDADRLRRTQLRQAELGQAMRRRFDYETA